MANGGSDTKRKGSTHKWLKTPSKLVRVLGALAVVLAVVIAFSGPECGTRGNAACPSYALGSPFILAGERGLGTLLGLLALILVACRLVIGGELPNSISSNSVGWPDDAVDAVESNKEMLLALQRQADAHDVSIVELQKELKDSVAKIKGSSTSLFGSLIGLVEDLSTETPGARASPASPDPPETGS